MNMDSSKSDLIEATYQKVSQLEHILIRPDTYIGSIEEDSILSWVFDDEKAKIVQKTIKYVPGLYKIFDEILVNAADNKQRDPKMDTIKININKENNEISIWNNGKGLPIVIHKHEKKYVPTMIFGTLLTSSNYNDSEKKVTGGRNGYGSKLCNIFSTEFIVETSSKEYKKTFKQVWNDNMSRSSEPIIGKLTPGVKEQDFTCVTFKPDFSKFKMTPGFTNDVISLFKRRAYDVAASCKGVKVYLNGEPLPIHSLKDYAKLYLDGPSSQDNVLIYEKPHERWEVVFSVSDTEFRHVSFVNSIATMNGGTHVNHVADQIVKEITAIISKKNKSKFQIKSNHIKNHMWLFINCLIENPAFSSQTKEHLNSNLTNFGSRCKLSDKFFKEVAKCGFVERILEEIRLKEESKFAKTMTSAKTNKLKDVPKLDDANFSGTQKSLGCTLILTEGDSAKTMAVAGLSVIGRDYYGVFPLKGKVLNVRDATSQKISDNSEVSNIIKILGLNYKRKYDSHDDLKTLRYGKLLIMTDQDADGSHIKGLLINLFEKFWPSLLKNGFIQEFITPIVKATKGKKSISFYSLPDLENWKTKTSNWTSYKIKYYKGLGTSTSEEAKQYFSDIQRHRIFFEHIDNSDNDLIDMAFNAKRVEDRKNWLTDWMESYANNPHIADGLYSSENISNKMSYKDFINKELVLFSYADLQRSIPSSIDGLKPGQRKVLYACLEKNIIGYAKEKKVAQLSGIVSEFSAYHHGEMSLMHTIVNLAQNFVGSNNINLLLPIGQFGTRIHGGSDSASARYIFTALTPIIRHIFHPDDDMLLKYSYDDNKRVEPLFYVPVIPMVLVNGAEGIGTGWSTKIPNFSPYEIIDNLRSMIHGQESRTMHPYYKNFTGHIIPEDSTNQKYYVFGECADLGDRKIEISELPLKVWTQNYKENKMELLLHGDPKKKVAPMIQDYNEYHTDTTVRFVVKMNEDSYMRCLRQNNFHKFFSLQSTLSMRNCVVFDEKGRLQSFSSAKDILDAFFKVRLHLYYARKEFLEQQLKAQCKLLTNQARFVQEIIDKKLIIAKKPKKELLEELKKKNYEPNPVLKWKASLKLIDEESNESKDLNENGMINYGAISDLNEQDMEEISSMSKDYDYLLSMSLWSLTKERIEAILKLHDEKMTEYETYVKTTPENIWLNDLNTLETELRKIEAKERQSELESISKTSKSVSLAKNVSNSKSKRSTSSSVNTIKSCYKDPSGISLKPQIEATTSSLSKASKTNIMISKSSSAKNNAINDDPSTLKTTLNNNVKKVSAASKEKNSINKKLIKSTKTLDSAENNDNVISQPDAKMSKIASFADRINSMKLNKDNIRDSDAKLGDSIIINANDSDPEPKLEIDESIRKFKKSTDIKTGLSISKNQISSSSNDKQNLLIKSQSSKSKKVGKVPVNSVKSKSKQKVLDSDDDTSYQSSELESSSDELDSLQSDDTDDEYSE